MAMWPFRRRGSRKRTRSGANQSDNEGRGRPNSPPRRSQTQPPERDVDGEAQPRTKQRVESNKLQRRARTYSFSPGRSESLAVNRKKRSPVPPVPSLAAGGYAMAKNDGDGNQGKRAFTSPSSEAVWDRVPTLHHNNSRNKRRGQDMTRRKSSKRRKEDHNREAEIKALSNFHPVRPATDNWTSGRPTKRESKRIGLSFNKKSDDPPSVVSLPLAESLHSSLSSDSEQVSWKVSALDALAPRPTLRYASNPYHPSSHGSIPHRTPSQKRRFTDRGPIPEETLKAHKRVDDLANELDSGDLREVMERDRRRKERKEERERERVERRLARRAARQKAAEEEAARTGTPPPKNLERGVMGREMVGLGIDPDSAVRTSSRRRNSASSTGQLEKSEEAAVEPQEQLERKASPLDNFHRADSIPLEPRSPVSPIHAQSEVPEVPEVPEPANNPAHERSPSPKIMSLLRSRKHPSKTSIQSESVKRSFSAAPAKFEDNDSGRRTSESSTSRPWMSLFRWGGKKRRSSGGPSSFSNTSRDSMLVTPPPQSTAVNFTSRKLSTGVPKRTMSRFREDLPELPLSPPDSRVGSPEAGVLAAEPMPIIPDDDATRSDSPDAMRATPISFHRNSDVPSPQPMSMSLASIDSEGSWLSGRANRKRASSGMRGSLTNYPMRTESALSNHTEDHPHSDEDMAIVEDEYLSSLSPNHHRSHSTGEARPSSDEEDRPEPKWGAVARRPTVVNSRHAEKMKSQEGLLNNFDDQAGDSSDSQSGHDTPVQRATSVNLGKGHVRNFSAGSAKLLDLVPRLSGEQRRSGIEPVREQ